MHFIIAPLALMGTKEKGVDMWGGAEMNGCVEGDPNEDAASVRPALYIYISIIRSLSNRVIRYPNKGL